MLKTYLIGVLASFTLMMLTEHLYYGAGHANTVTFKSIKEDFLCSLLSWIGVLLVIILFIGEYKTNFNMYGYSKSLSDFEDELYDKSNNDSDKN